MPDLAKCELCNEYFPIQKMSIFRLKSGELTLAGRDWWMKAGTRHICDECVSVVSDPFEESKAIRRGKGEVPPYEVLTGWIQRAPVTWLPALLTQVVTCCVVRSVFQDDHLLAYVERAEKLAGDPTSVLRRED